MYKDLIKQELRKNKKFLIWYTGSRDQAEYIEVYSKFLKDEKVQKELRLNAEQKTFLN